MILNVNKIRKKIGNINILKDITFNVKKGECVALVGPNGAGKTTLFNILLGNKFPTSGEFFIDNKKSSDFKIKEILGVLPQENLAPNKLKVKEILDFYIKIYKNSLTIKEIDELLSFSNIQKNKLISTLSGGQKRFLTFVLVLIGRPKIIFLDEPTSAMDTSTRKNFWQIINKLKSQGTTIIYSSHYIEEVEHTADRVLLLNNGELIRDTTPYALKSEKIEKIFILPNKYSDVVSSLKNIRDITKKTDNISFITNNAKEIWAELEKQGCSIEEIEIKNRTLLSSLFNTVKEKV